MQPKIGVQNSILAQVNGKTISMIDVKKKMDMAFHQHHPEYVGSNPALFGFYERSWHQALREMIDHELILADARDKEVQLTDGEVREEMEKRFGPNVTQTLDQISLTYDEAWNMVKDDLIVQRMLGWFVHLKAFSSVTPQDIRQAYRLFLEKNPPYSEWKYRVITLRTDTPNDELSQQLYQWLAQNGQFPEALALKEWEAPGIAIALSNEFSANDKDLSELHRASLAPLVPGSYSKPSSQISRSDKKTVYRIFYLVAKDDHPAPTFEAVYPSLQNELLNRAFSKESTCYLEKLRKRHGYETDRLLPNDFHPFSLQ
jgi:hypothetical protein